LERRIPILEEPAAPFDLAAAAIGGHSPEYRTPLAAAFGFTKPSRQDQSGSASSHS
jgi:hypothetical protein